MGRELRYVCAIVLHRARGQELIFQNYRKARGARSQNYWRGTRDINVTSALDTADSIICVKKCHSTVLNRK